MASTAIAALLGAVVAACLTQFGTAFAATVSVHNGVEFAQAFASPTVTLILVENDLYVEGSAWQGLLRPIYVQRDISIQAAPTVTMPMISVKSSDGSIRLAEGVVLSVTGCIVMQNRGRLGVLSPGLDLLAPSPANESGSFMLLYDNLLVHSVCLPRDLQVQTLSNITRPAAFPGRQDVGPLLRNAPNCTNGTDAPILQRCWPRWGMYVDLAVAGQDPDEQGKLRPTNVFLHLQDTQFVCVSIMQEDCIQTLGPTACFLYMYSLLPPTIASPRPPPLSPVISGPDWGPPMAGSESSKPPLLPLVLPCTLGGIAVLAALLGCLVAWCCRGSSGRRAKSVAGQQASSGKVATSGDIAMLRQGPSTESLLLAASNESAEQLCDAMGTGAGAAATGAAAGLLRKGAGCVPEVELKALAVAGCCVLPSPDTPVIVTPFTQHRSDLKLGVQCDAEVVLLPVVRGQGNFGRVLEGLYGGQRVAVKLVPDLSQWSGAGGPAALQSYVQEVEVLGRCAHPNIVRLLAACVTPPRLCLVMELMETSLDRLIHAPQGPSQGPATAGGDATPGGGGDGGGSGCGVGGGGERPLMPLDKVLHVGMEVARGLEYLHPTIVHRDLKPGNVLLNDPYGPRPVVKLTDFGLSRLRSTVLVTRHPEAGTPPYMAPELYDITNNVVTDKSDIYSLGVLLWEMLSGQVPWQGCDALVVAYAVTINRDRLPLSSVPPDRLPPKLHKLMERLWDHDPLRRPAAAEVVKQLALIQQDHARQMEAGRMSDAAGREAQSEADAQTPSMQPRTQMQSQAPSTQPQTQLHTQPQLQAPSVQPQP